MRWLIVVVLASLVAFDMGRYALGPPIIKNAVTLRYHPSWLPSVLTPLTPGLPVTAPISLPAGSYARLGALPPLSTPLAERLWTGQHNYVWPLSVKAAMAWAEHHEPSAWKPAGQGETSGPAMPTIYLLDFESERVREQTLDLEFRALAPGRTMVTVAVQSIMLLPRPAATILPPDATSVAIAYSTSRPRRRVLTLTNPHTLKILLDIVNRGAVMPLGGGNCAGSDTWDARLTFHYAHGSPIVVHYAPSCDWVVVGGYGSTPISAGGLYTPLRRMARTAGIRSIPPA